MACADCVCITGAKDTIGREYDEEGSCLIIPRGCPCPVYPDDNAPDTWLPAATVPYGTIPPQQLDQGHPIIPLPENESGDPLPITNGWFTVPESTTDTRNDGRYAFGGVEMFTAAGEVDGTPATDFEFTIPVNGDSVYIIDTFDSGGFDAPVVSTLINPATYVPPNTGSITNDRARDMLVRMEFRTGSPIATITGNGGIDYGMVNCSGINDPSIPDRANPFLIRALENEGATVVDQVTSPPAIWPIEFLLIPGDTLYCGIFGQMAVDPLHIGATGVGDSVNMRFGWVWSMEAREIETVSGLSVRL